MNLHSLIEVSFNHCDLITALSSFPITLLFYEVIETGKYIKGYSYILFILNINTF